MSEIHIDALLPQEMALRAETLGARKAEMPFLKMFMLAVLAGAFISLGAIFSTTVSAGSITFTAQSDGLAYSGSLPYGVTRLLAGLVFCLGLILVVVGGAELFTGNNLIVMAWASGKVTSRALLRNWALVYLGNFAGSFATAVLMFFTRQYTFGANAVGVTALKTAIGKVEYAFLQAVALGILCNALVCMAIGFFTDTFPARVSALSVPRYDDPQLKQFVAFLGNGRPYPVNAHWVQIAQALFDGIQRILSGDQDSQAAMDQANEEIQALLDS